MISHSFGRTKRKISSKETRLFNFEHVFQSGTQERVDLIKAGLPAEVINQFAKAMQLTKEQVMVTLGLPQSTIQRKIKTNQDLSMDQAEKVVGLSKLVGQVETMVAQSGQQEGFDAPQWLALWLDAPNQAIGNRRPAELMDTVTGQELVAALLAQMQSGAYA